MRNFDAIKERLAEEPDKHCNMAYMDGFRLGEGWSYGATVAELVSVGGRFKSMLEMQNLDESEMIDDYIAVMSHVTSLKFIGEMFARHIHNEHDLFTGGFDSSVAGMKDFEQGFLDGVRQYYKYVSKELEARMELYYRSHPEKRDTW